MNATPNPDAILSAKRGAREVVKANEPTSDAPPVHDDAGYLASLEADAAAATKGRKPGPDKKSGSDPWPEPLDFMAASDLVAPPSLESGLVPDVLHGFAADTAARMGVDPTSVAVAALVCCASVISEKWRVQPKRHDYSWTENARLWAAIVGDPSIRKTPVIAACTKPIERLEMEAARRHDEEVKAYKAAVAAAKADKTGGTPEPRGCPPRDRYLVEGATTEALSEVLRDDVEAKQRAPQGKVLARHDELSEFFGGLDRYKAGGKGGSDRGAYLRLYNGGHYVMDRVMRGSFSIPSWSACFLGGVQPAVIQRIARDTADDGLLQRFIYVAPGHQDIGQDVSPDREVRDRYAALFPALVALHPAEPIGGGPVRSIVFDAAAHEHREHVDAMARALSRMPDVSPRLKTSLDKWSGLFARLALTFHLVELADARAQGTEQPVIAVIPERTASRVATFMLDVLLPHLQRADAVMFASTQTGHATWIAGHILTHHLQTVTARDIAKAYGALRAPEARRELEAVMTSLVTVGWLEPVQSENPVKPVTTWKVNPAVHTRFEERAERERARREAARVEMETAFAERRRRKAQAAGSGPGNEQ